GPIMAPRARRDYPAEPGTPIPAGFQALSPDTWRQVMNPMRRRILRLAPALLCTPAASGLPGTTQPDTAWPSRPVRVIVPFPPGGGTDILARLVAQKLGSRLGQEFFVENIAGAGGNTGAGHAARATPDGHTVLFVFGSFVVNPSLFA